MPIPGSPRVSTHSSLSPGMTPATLHEAPSGIMAGPTPGFWQNGEVGQDSNLSVTDVKRESRFFPNRLSPEWRHPRLARGACAVPGSAPSPDRSTAGRPEEFAFFFLATWPAGDYDQPLTDSLSSIRLCRGTARMSGKTYRWWLRFAVGGLWALALGIAFAPAEARAGCGDGLVPLAAGHHASRPAPADTHTGKPIRRPCSGPLCSRAPLAPAPALPDAPAPRGVDDSCTLSPLAFLPTSSLLSGLPDDPPGSPTRCTSDIYHPPR
jgi:hypothetical protein